MNYSWYLALHTLACSLVPYARSHVFSCTTILNQPPRSAPKDVGRWYRTCRVHVILTLSHQRMRVHEHAERSHSEGEASSAQIPIILSTRYYLRIGGASTALLANRSGSLCYTPLCNLAEFVRTIVLCGTAALSRLIQASASAGGRLRDLLCQYLHTSSLSSARGQTVRESVVQHLVPRRPPAP